jgi:hypothetical protein
MKDFYGYKVSTEGVVYNKDGTTKSLQLSPKGYLFTRFHTGDGVYVTKSAHRLVAELYIDKPDGKTEVDHIDGNRTNNCLSNLRWVTHGENVQHSYDSGRRVVSGERNANCKVLKEEDVRKVCELIVKGYTPPQISRQTNVPYSNVRMIFYKKNWKHVSDEYFSEPQRSETIRRRSRLEAQPKRETP